MPPRQNTNSNLNDGSNSSEAEPVGSTATSLLPALTAAPLPAPGPTLLTAAESDPDDFRGSRMTMSQEENDRFAAEIDDMMHWLEDHNGYVDIQGYCFVSSSSDSVESRPESSSDSVSPEDFDLPRLTNIGPKAKASSSTVRNRARANHLMNFGDVVIQTSEAATVFFAATTPTERAIMKHVLPRPDYYAAVSVEVLALELVFDRKTWDLSTDSEREIAFELGPMGAEVLDVRGISGVTGTGISTTNITHQKCLKLKNLVETNRSSTLLILITKDRRVVTAEKKAEVTNTTANAAAPSATGATVTVTSAVTAVNEISEPSSKSSKSESLTLSLGSLGLADEISTTTSPEKPITTTTTTKVESENENTTTTVKSTESVTVTAFHRLSDRPDEIEFWVLDFIKGEWGCDSEAGGTAGDVDNDSILFSTEMRGVLVPSDP